MNYETVKLVESSELDRFVEEIYGKPFCFQQQAGCRSRGTISVTVPVKYLKDFEEGYDAKEVAESEGYYSVSLKDWLDRDPDEKFQSNEKYDWETIMIWQRNFYPDIDVIFDDLHKKGLIEEGKYLINISW